jgi:hypothetical protein
MPAEADLIGAVSCSMLGRIKELPVAAIPKLRCAYAFALSFDERI